MTQRTCLIIDDDDQSEVFDTIKREGQKHGLDIECLQFNVGNPSEREILVEEQVSAEKVIEVLRERYRGKKIHLIAIDWDLSVPSMSGPQLIKRLNDNNLRDKVPKILYSGILKNEIEKLCNEFKAGDKQFQNIWGEINTLITTDIKKFAKRDEYEIEIVNQLKKVEDSIESSIEEELLKYPDAVFKNSFVSKNFNGKSFEEIAKIIETDTPLRNELTKEVTQQVMAYISKIV
jgi:hypothetical protein